MFGRIQGATSTRREISFLGEPSHTGWGGPTKEAVTGVHGGRLGSECAKSGLERAVRVRDRQDTIDPLPALDKDAGAQQTPRSPRQVWLPHPGNAARTPRLGTSHQHRQATIASLLSPTNRKTQRRSLSSSVVVQVHARDSGRLTRSESHPRMPTTPCGHAERSRGSCSHLAATSENQLRRSHHLSHFFPPACCHHV